MTQDQKVKRFVRVMAVICVLLALALVARVVQGTQTQTAPSNNSLATRTTPSGLDYSRTQTTTFGNVSDEVTSLTVWTTSTMVAIWCTGENAMVNWWSTAKTDLGTTNGWFVEKDKAPARFDGFVLGVSGESSCVLWFASRSATSATAVVIEFQDINL